MLVYPRAPSYSSLNSHSIVVGVTNLTSSSSRSLLSDDHLDVIVLVSALGGKIDVLVRRVGDFLVRLHEATFNEDHGTTPFWRIAVYNESTTRELHALTQCFECVVEAVREGGLATLAREMRSSNTTTSSSPSSNPSRISLALGEYVRAASEQGMSSDQPLVRRPHAHQHVIVLDGAGLLPSSSNESFSTKPIRGTHPTSDQVAAHNTALASLLTQLSAPGSAQLALSFALFFDASHNAFFNASLGSPRHSVAYAHDSSHYNTALTLRALIRRDRTAAVAGAESSSSLPGQDASLVAQMLSRAFVTRAHDIRSLDHLSKVELSSVWESHYRHPRLTRPWCSACERWKCSREAGWERDSKHVTCPVGQECSILHGCHTPLPRGTIRAQKAGLGVTEITGVTSAITSDPEEEEAEAEKTEETTLVDLATGDVEVEVDLAADAADAVNADHFGTTSSATTNESAASFDLPGAPFPLFHTSPYTSGSHRWTRDHLMGDGRHQIETKVWDPSRSFTSELIAGGRPCILKNTIVSRWSALEKWNATYLRDHFTNANRTLRRTKVSSASRNFFDPDVRTPLSIPLLVNLTMTFDERELDPHELFEAVTNNFTRVMGVVGPGETAVKIPSLDEYVPPTNESLYYHFDSFPPDLLADVTPYAHLFDTESDVLKRAMYLWFSSGGVNMHSHFDQDHNFFVQLAGTKRFTLVMPEQWEEMHLFPRIHPLWHKSQVDADQPDLDLFPDYSRVRAYLAEVGPGDVLYIPPYTWHQVETVTPSVSLSIWSHDVGTVELMERVYLHDHKFDLLGSTRGRTFALRLYIDLMVHELYGANQTTSFVQQIIERRYRAIVDVFREERRHQRNADDAADATGGTQQTICPADKIPTAQHVSDDEDKGQCRHVSRASPLDGV